MTLIRALFFFLFTTSAAFAGPGAHGPNGEHLDAPGTGHVHSDTGPRIDTFTESFELVGRLQDGELSILIDRYETNEPVLNGKLEVEFNGLKALAKFHADHGDYAIDDVNFIKALTKPGKHALVFTLTAGEESDLLEGTLDVKSQDQTHGRFQDAASGFGYSPKTWTVAGVLLAIVLMALLISFLRRKGTSGK